MGVEMAKPLDGSDVASDLAFAMNEVIRLRHALGHLAKGAGFSEVIYDASDLVKGENKDFDRLRCVAEVVHIRSALRLATAGDKRRARAVTATDAPPVKSFFDMAGSDDDGSSSSSSSDNDNNDNDDAGDGGEEEDEMGKKADGKSNVMPTPPSAAQQLQRMNLSAPDKETSPPLVASASASASTSPASLQADAAAEKGAGSGASNSKSSTKESSPRSP